MQAFDFKSSTVFVAGGTSGINLGIAEAFAEAGAKLAVMSRSQQRVDEAKRRLQSFGGEVVGYSADVRNIDATTAALKAALLADLVVVPAAPSGMDLSGLMEAKELALTAGRPYRLLANRITKNTTMTKSLLNVLEEDGHLFQACIPQSVKFVEAETEGLYIGDYAPESNPHIEVRKFAKEVVSFFKNNEQ